MYERSTVIQFSGGFMFRSVPGYQEQELRLNPSWYFQFTDLHTAMKGYLILIEALKTIEAMADKPEVIGNG